MDCQSKNNYSFYRTRLLIFFFSCFSAFSIFAKVEGKVEISPSFVRVGDSFSVRFIFANDLKDSLKIQESNLPLSIKKIGDYVLTFDIKDNQTRVEFFYQSLKSGVQTIPPYTFFLGKEGKWISESISLEVSENWETLYKKNSPRLWLEASSSKVYPLENLVLTLFLLGDNSVPLQGIKDIQIESYPSCLSFKRVPLFSERKALNVEKISTIARPLANWIVSSHNSGKFTIPPIEIHLKDQKIKSNSLSIDVLSYPDENLSSGVGNFTISLVSNKKEVSFKEKLQITLTLSGEGNFIDLKLPSLSLEGAKIIGYQKDNMLTPSGKGFKGSLYEVYEILPNDKKITLLVPSWSYWNPFLKKQINLEEIRQEISVTDFQPKETLTSLSEQLNYLPVLSTEEIFNQDFSLFYKKPIFYLGLIPGFFFWFFAFQRKSIKFFLVFLILFFLCLGTSSFFIKKKEFSSFKEIFPSFSIDSSKERVDEIVKEVEKLSDENFSNYIQANLFYDIGVSLSKKGDFREAIYRFYQALKRNPSHFYAQEALKIVSKLSGKINTIKFSSFYWMNTFFISLLILWNLFSAAWFFLSRYHLYRFFIGLAFFLMGFINIFLLIYLSSTKHYSMAMVIGSFVPILKVPDPLVRSWIFIEGGEDVYVLEQIDNYCLVQFASGIQGWLDQDYLKIIT